MIDMFSMMHFFGKSLLETVYTLVVEVSMRAIYLNLMLNSCDIYNLQIFPELGCLLSPFFFLSFFYF